MNETPTIGTDMVLLSTNDAPDIGADPHRQHIQPGTHRNLQTLDATTGTRVVDAGQQSVSSPGRQLPAMPMASVGFPAPTQNLGTIDADAALDADGPYNAGSLLLESLASDIGVATISLMIGVQDVSDDVA